MNKKDYNPQKVYCRSIARSMAKHNMATQGINMHKAIKRRFFANNWRSYV